MKTTVAVFVFTLAGFLPYVGVAQSADASIPIPTGDRPAILSNETILTAMS